MSGSSEVTSSVIGRIIQRNNNEPYPEKDEDFKKLNRYVVGPNVSNSGCDMYSLTAVSSGEFIQGATANLCVKADLNTISFNSTTNPTEWLSVGASNRRLLASQVGTNDHSSAYNCKEVRQPRLGAGPDGNIQVLHYSESWLQHSQPTDPKLPALDEDGAPGECWCYTEAGSDRHCSIMIGLSDTIPRWVLGSTVKYVINRKSFEVGDGSEDHADLVDEAMKKATDMWRGVGVTFQPVKEGHRATFEVRREKNGMANELARAFYPGSDNPVLRLFHSALQHPNKEFIANILAHELGHILGLRHEFALEKEICRRGIRYGRKNPKSIMNRHNNPGDYCVQKEDLEELASFYNSQAESFDGMPIVRYTPTEAVSLSNAPLTGATKMFASFLQLFIGRIE